MLWHLLIVLFLGLAFVTGLRIAYDNARGGWRGKLELLMIQGDVVRWHAWAALALGALVVAYGVFLWRARLAVRWKVSGAALRVPVKAARWQAINRAMYWGGLAAFLVTLLTGILLYFFPIVGGLELLTLIHEIGTWVLVLYMVAHVVAQFMLGGLAQLLKILNPRADHRLAGLAMLVAGLAATGSLWAVDHLAMPDLVMQRVAAAPVLDGDWRKPLWQSIPAVEVMTAHGHNVLGGDTPVRVRGVVHGDRAYFLFEWKDSTRSFKRMPLMKTDKGWKLLNDNYARADVTDYYEDKFAVAFSSKPNAFGGSWHFGGQPLPGKPESTNGRGFHATLDGSHVDLWHWKATRTGPLGQMDDSHFGPPVAAQPGKRYSAGYGQDAKTGGGYSDNWTKVDEHSYEYVIPKRLPKDPAALFERLGPANPDPTVSDKSAYGMRMEDTVPYAPELDTYPVGTLLPAILWNGPFQGDRGDISAQARWEDGWWHLEASRQLETPSKQDVPLRDKTYLWFSAFDHNQTRHSWHVMPVRLRLPD